MAKRRSPAYSSSTLATSERMIAPGPHHAAVAVIYDLMWRARSLEQLLPYEDRTTGKPLLAEADALRAEASRRIDKLPKELRVIWSRKNWARET